VKGLQQVTYSIATSPIIKQLEMKILPPEFLFQVRRDYG